MRQHNRPTNWNLKCNPIFGLVAQPGERTVRIRKVEGSIPFESTMYPAFIRWIKAGTTFIFFEAFKSGDNMNFYKHNGYPEIFLHDCRCKPVYEDQTLRLVFDDGFCMQTSEGRKQTKGYIQFSNLPLQEVSIRGFKGEPRPGKYVEIVEDLSFRELCQVLEDASLEVWDEYYCQGQALYKCCIYPYKEGQLWDQVEITVHFEGKKIEYYIED